VVAPPPKPEPKPKPEPPRKPGLQVRSIDVVFVVDATSSMNLEIESVRFNMNSIVQVLRRISDDVRVGFVAYVDHAVSVSIPLKTVVRNAAGEANLRRLKAGIDKVKLIGNEDWPEDVCAGLARAAAMPWPPPTGERRQIIILIGDAKTHPADRARSLRIVRDWTAESPNRSVNTVNTCLEIPLLAEFRRETRRYFKELAKAGHGKYFENKGDLLGSILDILIIR
jgi:hypothetical protein